MHFAIKLLLGLLILCGLYIGYMLIKNPAKETAAADAVKSDLEAAVDAAKKAETDAKTGL